VNKSYVFDAGENMQGAILIIGSLLWDQRDVRRQWRQRRLRINEKEYVRVPLEYGRRSKGKARGNTFTMTLQPDAPNGQAILVPFAAPITRIEGLLEEAEQLWQAEQPGADSGRLGAAWGCVGLQFRTAPSDLFEEWCEHFRKRKTSAISPVNDCGSLCIPWPIKASSSLPVDYDFILATATQRECVRPTAEDIADAWIDQSANYVHYFFENVRLGIRTDADLSIWRRIEKRNPSWLASKCYNEAIRILKDEAETGN